MIESFYPSKLRQQRWIGIFVIYLRYLIGAAFVFSAISKIEGHRFTTADGTGSPIDTGVHYFETMYRSGMYWIALGWAQLLAGLILMSQKLATLGAVMMLPISINIFLITVTYHFPGTVYITFLILLANLFLLYWDLPQLYNAFKTESMHPMTVSKEWADAQTGSNFWAWLGILLFFTTVVYVVVFERNPLLWMLLCSMEGGIGLFLYKYVSKQGQAN